MQIGTVVLPVSLDISQISTQARQLTNYLGKLNIPGASNLEKKLTTAIDYTEVFAKAAKTFADRQAVLSRQTATHLNAQAKNYLSLQQIATKSLGIVGKSLMGVFTSIKASHLPVLGGISALSAGLLGLSPVITNLILPMFGLTGGLGGLAGAFLNAQMAALSLGSRGFIGLIKTTADLLSSTSTLRASLKGLAIPSDLFSAFGNLATSFKDAGNQVVALKKKIDALGQNLISNAQSILSGAQGVFANATAMAGAAPAANPMAAAFDANKGIGEYVAFEQNATAFKSLAKGAGATAEQIKAVTEEAKRLGAQTSKSAVEASALSIAMLRLGISADQVDDAMGGVVKTSEATGENLTQVGSIVASSMSQFQIAGDQSAKIGDLLGKMANVSATSIAEIGEALKYVGGAANAANQSLQDVVVVLGAVSDSQKGSVAGTNLSNALISLQKAASVAKTENNLFQQSTKLTKQELDEMAMSAQGAGQAVEALGSGTKIKGKILEVLGISKEDLLDSQGKLKSLLEIIPVIRQAVQNMEATAEGTAQVPILINALFGEQGSRTILSLINQTDEQLNALKQSAETASGFTAQVSEEMLSGISGSLKKLVSATQGVSLVVGETFAPVVKFFADEIIYLLNSFLRLPPAFQKLALVGATVMPFMILYWKYLGFQKQAIAALVLAKQGLILAQTAEGRQQIVLNIQNSISEAKTKALTVAKAAQITVTKVLRGELSLLAAAQMGVNKALTVVAANYKSYFSTLVYSLNQIQLQIKGLGQLALSLTTVNVGQVAHNAVVAIGTGIKSAYLGAVEMVNAAITRHIALKSVETQAVAKGNIVQSLSTGITKALTVAKTALAMVTGRLSAANLGLAGTYAVLAARLTLIYGAFLSVKKAWEAFTAGSENVKAINETRDQIIKLNETLGITAPVVKQTGNALTRFFEDLKNGKDFVLSIQKALNLTTQDMLSMQRSIIALEGQLKAVNVTFDNGIAIINKYGLVQVDQADKARLGAEGIANFTAEAKKQNQVIQSTIEALKAQKPANDAEAQQINNQIKLLENQSMQLRKRSDFLNFDTDITNKNAESQKVLDQNIEQLTGKYENLAKAQSLNEVKAILEIEESLAAQTIKSAQAISERERIETEALKNRIDLNNQALEELKKSAEWMPNEDRIKAEEEISKRTEEAIKLRIELAKQEVEERQKLNDELIKNEQEKLQVLEAQQQLKVSQQVLQVKQQQVSGGISKESADTQFANIEKQAIQDLIDLEKQRFEGQTKLLKQGAINEKEFAAIKMEAAQKNIELQTQMADKEIQIAEAAAAKLKEQNQKRVDAQREAINNQISLGEVALQEQITQIKKSQLAGELSAKESVQKINEIKQAQLENEIKIYQQSLISNQQMLKQGLINEKQYADEKNKISSKIASHQQVILDEQIKQQAQANSELLAQLDEMANRRRQAFEENQKQQELALKQQQLSGGLSSEEFENKKQQTQIDAAKKSVEIARQKIQEIQGLESKGLALSEEIISKREAAERELLQNQINLVDQQLAAKKRLEDAAKEEAEEQKKLAKEMADAEKQKNEQILQDFENRLAAEQAARELNNVAGIASVRKQQLAGVKSKEQAEAAIAQLEQQARQAELAGLQQQLVEVQNLQAQGVLSAQEAVKRKAALSKELADGNLALIEQEIQAEERKNQKILQNFENRLAAEQAKRELSNVAGITAVRKQQLAGVKSKEDVEAAIAQLEQQARQKELAGIQQQLMEVQKLQAQGVLSAAEAAKRKAALNKELADGNLALIEQEIQAEERKNQKILQDFENRLAAEQAKRELSNVAGIASVRAQQLAGVKSKEQAEAAIAQLEQQARQAELVGIQRQLAEVQKLQMQGILSVEEAAKRKAVLNKELADGNLALIEQQIQAEEQAAQRAIEAKLKVVEANLKAARTPLEMQSGRSDIASSRLGLSGNLATVQTGVMEAVNALEQQRIDFQLRQLELQAENAKSEVDREKKLLEAEKLKSQAFKDQFAAMQQSQQAAQVQLEISQRQKEIELQREKISARIALLESQAELQKAKINGASFQEIQALAEMVKLRQETLSFTDEAIAGQQELKKLEAERLRIQQQAEKEKAAQERLLELERKATEATGREREHILQQLKESKRLQKQMGDENRMKLETAKPLKLSNFEFSNLDLQSSPVGMKLKQNLAPMMFKKSSSMPSPVKAKTQNFTGDIVGAKEIVINVSSGDRSLGADIERTVFNALGSVIDKTRAKINQG